MNHITMVITITTITGPLAQVGLTHGQTADDWREEVQKAQAAGIDGFALNIGPSDPWTVEQLDLAYSAAAAASSTFSSPFVLFLSFDMAAGEWSVDQVVTLVTRFSDRPAQCRESGAPLVSTFEGPAWAENWALVREAVPGGIFLVPDWSSLGPHGVGHKLDLIDGAFSWCAWPKAGQHAHSPHWTEDRPYMDVLGRKEGKVYMMGVSPWFYTRLPQWNKNWHSSSQRLWFERWVHIWHQDPKFVQIITWNDYGESSYICDPKRPSQIVPGAEKYVLGHSHDAFLATLPYFIQLYKAGLKGNGPPLERDCAVAWYRTTLASCGPDGDTVWGQGGTQSAREGTSDNISMVIIAEEPWSLVLTIGDSAPQQIGSCDYEGRHKHQVGLANCLEVPIHGRTGSVTISFNGRTTTGPAITDECPPFGHVTFNCTAIQI